MGDALRVGEEFARAQAALDEGVAAAVVFAVGGGGEAAFFGGEEEGVRTVWVWVWVWLETWLGLGVQLWMGMLLGCRQLGVLMGW